MGRRDGSRGAWVLRLLLVASLAAAVALTGCGADLVNKWGTDGIVTGTGTGTGTGPNDRFDSPYDVAVGDNFGKVSVYVADTDNNRIVKLDGEDGGLGTEWGNEGIVTGPGQEAESLPGGNPRLYPYNNPDFLDPSGVAVGPNGNVYVADTSNNRIVKLARDKGELVTEWGDGGILADVQFNRPSGVAVGPDGNLYVADTDNNRIVKLDGDDGGLVTEWGNEGIVTGPELGDNLQFLHPADVAVGPEGNVYVADTDNNRIVKLDGEDGGLGTEWGNEGIVTGPGQEAESLPGGNPRLYPYNNPDFLDPAGVAVGPDLNVYVADSGNGRIVTLDPNGELFCGWTDGCITVGAGRNKKGEFLYFGFPRGVAVGPNGCGYLADTDNHRILKYKDGFLGVCSPVSDVGNGSDVDCSDQAASIAVTSEVDNQIDCGAVEPESMIEAGQLEEVRIEPQGRAGLSDNVKISFRTNNPVPAGGKVVVTLPEGFIVDSETEAVVNDVGDPANVESRDIDARSVTVVFNNQIEPDADVVLMLSDIKHPAVSGPPTEGGSVETQTSTGALIDSCLHGNDACTIGYTDVKPGQLEEVRIEPQGRAGLSEDVKISFRTTNPVPEGGKVVVTLPEGFVVDSETWLFKLMVSTNMAGGPYGLNSSMDIDARSVTVVFNNQIESYADVVLGIADIKHPAVSGTHTEGGSVETQNSTGAPIDSCLHGNDGCTIGYTEVKPGFVTGLVFDLENEELDRADDDLLHTAAGSTGEIFVSFRTTNFVSMNDKVVVTFPEGFVVGPDANVSDDFEVTSSEGRTVDIALWVEIQPGELVTLKLSDIKNPPFTGDPQGGRIVTWDMAGVVIDQSIDGAFDNEDDYHEACEAQVIASCEDAYVTVDRITPGKLTDNEVMLDNKKAGGTGPVTVTFRLDNPLPANGAIAVTFPKGFVLNSGGATEAHLINPDEGTVGVEVYEVDEVTTAVFFRNGTGDELKPEEVEPVVVQLTNIRSPQVSGQTHNFEIRTSLGK